jgi:ABC-type dipeptide/oligopeptide/nickel transport system permease subunit
MKSFDKRVVVGVMMLGILVLLALAIPAMRGSSTSVGNIDEVLDRRLTPPFAHDIRGQWHMLGTDAFGRDIALRLWSAARISLGVGVLGSLLAGFIGIALGALAAWSGGVVDRILMALGDALLAVPRLVLLLVIAALWGPGLTVVVSVLALTGWMSVMRLVRTEILGVRRLAYIEGAEALGIAPPRLIMRHILPNALGSAIVAITLGVGNAILLESGLSFLGLGIQPPTASWGNMIAGGRDWLLIAPWIALVPGVALIVTVVACTLIGDGLTVARRRE